MKHLKPYRFNESRNVNELQDIKDICLELQDQGFAIFMSQKDFRGHCMYVIDVIKKGGNYYASIDSILYRVKDFNYSEISEVVERIEDYLGYNVSSIRWSNCYIGSEKDRVNAMCDFKSSVFIDGLIKCSFTFVNPKLYESKSDTNDYWKIPFTFDKPNPEIKKIFDYQGEPIKMTQEEIDIVDNILKPYKSNDLGKHVGHEPSEYNKVVTYPPINWKHTNTRSGYCWFLKKILLDKKFRISDEYEVMINKFDSDYYIVNISNDWHVSHFSGSGPHLIGVNDWYIVDTIDELKKLLKDKVIPLYQKSQNESIQHQEFYASEFSYVIKKDVEDICQELIDIRFICEWTTLPDKSLSLEICRSRMSGFRKEVVSETIERIKDYMGMNGYSTIVLTNGHIEKDYEEIVNLIDLKFTQNEKPCNESVNKEELNDLEDILLELKDEGWITEISNPNMSRDYYTLLVNRNWDHDRIGYELKSFGIHEISETILRIIDYLISKGIDYELSISTSVYTTDITDKISGDLSKINIDNISLKSIVIKFWK